FSYLSSSSTECLNLSHHITFVRASLACLRASQGAEERYRTAQLSTNDVHTSLEKRNCDLVNHQHFRLVSSTKVKIDLVIVFIFKDPFLSRLSLVLVIGNEHWFKFMTENVCSHKY